MDHRINNNKNIAVLLMTASVLQEHIWQRAYKSERHPYGHSASRRWRWGRPVPRRCCSSSPRTGICVWVSARSDGERRSWTRAGMSSRFLKLLPADR